MVLRLLLGASILGGVGVTLSSEAPAAWAANRGQSFEAFQDRVLAAHNLERNHLGVHTLTWDADLAAGAAQYANELGRTNNFKHSPRATRYRIGENLWMGTRGAYSVESMMDGWLTERRLFMPGIFPNVSRSGNWADVGHYTQMVSRHTTKVGCAVGTSRSSDYLVCRYSPSGNIDGRPVF